MTELELGWLTIKFEELPPLGRMWLHQKTEINLKTVMKTEIKTALDRVIEAFRARVSTLGETITGSIDRLIADWGEAGPGRKQMEYRLEPKFEDRTRR